MTPMPPTMSAITEKIQPASMMRRLDVSTLTTAPGSVTATAPGNALLDELRDVARPPAERDRDAERRHLAGPLGERLDGRERQHDAAVHEAVAGVVEARDRGSASPSTVTRVAGLEAERAGAGVAEQRLRARVPGGRRRSRAGARGTRPGS